MLEVNFTPVLEVISQTAAMVKLASKTLEGVCLEVDECIFI